MTTKHRHVRIDDTTWDKGQQRAAREGTTLSAVIREFVVAYAAGQLTRNWIKRLKPIDENAGLET
jgi:hypothetical protein